MPPPQTTDIHNTMDELKQRAFAAYFRSGGTEQPSSKSGSQKSTDGKEYVVLRNVNSILAVYRVKPDGVLKRLKRYPAELESN